MKNTIAKRPRWTQEDEKLLLDNRTAQPFELQIVYFPNRSVASVSAKLNKLLQEQQFTKRGPWTEQELDLLAKNLDFPNWHVQQSIPRPAGDINMMRWTLRQRRIPKYRGSHGAPEIAKHVANNGFSMPVEKFNVLYQKAQAIRMDGLGKIALDELRRAQVHLRKFEKLLEADQL